jgi:signal transduction histidine kinase/ActR/RegA family two-component response regulator
MTPPRLRGLATIVPALVVAAVCLTAGAAALLALHFGRAAILDQELDQLLHVAENYATSVRFYLDGARSTLETTAPLTPLRDALAAPAGTGERAEAMARTRGRAALILERSRFFDDVMLLDAEGMVVMLEPASLEKAQVRRDRAYSTWYKEVVRTGRTVFSDLQLSPTTLEPTVVIAVPVRGPAGNVLGIWAGSLRLAELSRVGRANVRSREEHGFLTDHRGRVVAHQSQARYVQHQTDFSSVPAVRAALAGDRGTGRFQNPIERIEQLTAWVPLGETGWAVVYEQPVASALAPIRSLTRNIMTFAAAIAVGLGLVGLALARRVVRPIERLTRAAEHVGTTVPHFEVPVTGSAEVGRLAEALNRMGAVIAEKDATLRQRAEELERLVQELEAAGRAKDEFLATLSHELRTPLNAVYGWARVLRAEALNPATGARALEAVERNAAALAQLIDDLLDVSRIVTGKMRLDVRTVDPGEVVRAALDTVRLAAEAKGVRLYSVLDPRAGPIKGDPERLQQIVWNLLVNAVKFTPRGGRVHVHLQRINSHVELVVNDSGQGIAPEVLPHIFERFRQAESGSARSHTGLGIGLALVRHLVELHGGSVHAHSEGEGKGATFVVNLPLLAVEALPIAGEHVHPAARTGRAGGRGPDLDGVRVLVVDDDLDSLDLMAAVLGQRGAIVTSCATASAALEEFERACPDVLLSDIEMPGEDGYSLIRRIRARSPARGGKVPAAAITAYGRMEDRVRALSAGFTMHVAKPVEPSELTAVVASLARQSA